MADEQQQGEQQRNVGTEVAEQLAGKLRAESTSDLHREDPKTVAERILSVVQPRLQKAVESFNEAVPEAAELKLKQSDRLLRLLSVAEPKLGVVFNGPAIALLPPNATTPLQVFDAETEFPEWTFSGGQTLDDVVKAILLRANEIGSNG